MNMQIPQEVLASYHVAVRSADEISGGLIHETYRIHSDVGEFVLQKLHPKLATDEIATDFANVTEFLKTQSFPAPGLIRTKDDKVLAKDANGGSWRMQTYIDGETFGVAASSEMVASAAGMYARFHRCMSDFPHGFQSQREAHATRLIYQDALSTFERYSDDPLFDAVEGMCGIVERELPTVFLPTDLPERVIHGDPKISNVRFRSGEAVALLDLDTCGRQTVPVELGDAFRSWCGKAEEDPNNTFNVEYFRAGWMGYLGAAEGFLTRRECELVPQATAMITLELAARFLKDYFEDTYFGWDDDAYTGRRAHNLARAKGQIALYRDIKDKLPSLQKIVNRTIAQERLTE